MQAPHEISISPPEVDAPLGDLENGIQTGEVVNSDVSLQIPPRPIGSGSSHSGKDLLQSQDSMNGGSSSGGLLQALSLRKKFKECESERTPLLNLEDKAALEPVSEPLTPASNPSPFVSTPVSANASNTGSLQAPESRPLSDESSDIISVLEDFLNVALVTAFFFFFFLEFLLVDDMRNEAFLVAFPCAFFLGLLSSIFAVLIAIDYMWRYAALEFAVVAMVIFLFHSLLHLKPLWEIAVSSILGFSMSMSLNKLYTRYFG